ncbi:hypothetical protein Tco_0893489 [Tanacetum coccineum]|uniref:HAT C-terminal dimerisation domain-containing protein n=1 Tax=Tanacetum coccineum TaxID=301880 RepID=A0ABQ5CBP9_9ASTR
MASDLLSVQASTVASESAFLRTNTIGMKGDGLRECQTNHNQAGNDMYVFKDWWEDVDEVRDVYDESENDSEDVKSLDGFDRDVANCTIALKT